MTIKEFENLLLTMRCECENIHPDVDNREILIKLKGKYYEPNMEIEDSEQGGVNRNINITLGE
tara:strand:- start:249 stop:437 length:189 start_codon:yes stop_codon:yes gene_type:complete